MCGRPDEFVHVGIDQAAQGTIGDLPRGRGILGLVVNHPVPIRLDDMSNTWPRRLAARDIR